MKIERRVHRRVGTAIREHSLIEDGDKILIGVSGGVDSSVLSKILAEKQRHYPVKFELVGCHAVVDIREKNYQEIDWLKQFFEKIEVPLLVNDVQVMKWADPDKPMNCYICSMQRRKEIIKVALEQGCNKIAYGHHQDDIVETLLMNMIYNSEISTMPVKLALDNYDLSIIRPLARCLESEVKNYARRFDITQQSEPCPYGEEGKRKYVKDLITQVSKDNQRVRENIAASLNRVKLDYLVEKS